MWPPLCNAKFLAVFVSEGAGGPPPRKSLNDGNPYAGAGVSAIYSSSVGAHISTRGLLDFALLAIRQARVHALASRLIASTGAATQGLFSWFKPPSGRNG